MPTEPFDEAAVFLHDVPADVVAESAAHLRDQSGTPFEAPWPLVAWPDVPTRFLLCRDDRMFPAEFQRRVVAARLGITPDEMAGGHLPALAHPEELVAHLLRYAAELPAPASADAGQPATALAMADTPATVSRTRTSDAEAPGVEVPAEGDAGDGADGESGQRPRRRPATTSASRSPVAAKTATLTTSRTKKTRRDRRPEAGGVEVPGLQHEHERRAVDARRHRQRARQHAAGDVEPRSGVAQVEPEPDHDDGDEHGERR